MYLNVQAKWQCPVVQAEQTHSLATLRILGRNSRRFLSMNRLESLPQPQEGASFQNAAIRVVYVAMPLERY